jgi:hypothetical protein
MGLNYKTTGKCGFLGLTAKWGTGYTIARRIVNDCAKIYHQEVHYRR